MDISKEKTKEVNAKDVAWKLFKESGNINYYRLYSDLKNESEEEQL